MHPEINFYYEDFYMNRIIGIILFYTFVAITGMHIIFAFADKLQIREANNLVEITDINSFLNTFGKNIVEVSLPCEITIDNEYNEAWNEINKSDKNGSMCKIQDNSLKNFAPWSILLW
ncbi:20236_t:CDS:2, partial [Gigaspora margarita]